MVRSSDTQTTPFPVKVGALTLDSLMTVSQARRWGERNMPKDLRAAGFKVSVSRTDPLIHGGTWLRVNYGK